MKFRFQVIVFLFIAFASHLAGPAILKAQSPAPQAWTNLGLYGGQIYDIAVDPSDPDKMFAGSYMGDGLFVTADGGTHWNAVETEGVLPGEDTFKNHAVWSVKIAPRDSDVVWAAHNYWVEKSTDGGQTWEHIYNSSMQRDCSFCGGMGDNFRFCRAVAIHPTDSDIVYVGTGGPSGAYAAGAIYMTADGGATWEKLNQGTDLDYSVTDIAFDPQDPDRMWAVTSSYGAGGVWGGSLYLSEDGGQSLERISTLDSGFLSVAPDPVDSQRVLTGSGYGVIEHYLDESGWTYRWPVIEGASVAEAVCFDPQNPQIVYAAWLTPVSWGGDGIGKIGRSLDGGNTWDVQSHDYDFMTLSVHPSDSEVVFAGDRSLGIYRSEDHGLSWNALNEGINAVVVYDVATDPNDADHLLAGTQSGLYERKNQAGAWSRLLPYNITALAWHPTDSRTFYGGGWQFLAKTEDGGASWGFTGLAINYPVESIAVDPVDPDTLFAAIGSQVHKSQDGGASFASVLEGVNQGGETYPFNAVAIDPQDTEHVFAGGGGFYAPKVLGDLWESMDGGVNWTRSGLTDVIVNALLVDPGDPDRIYAGCGYSAGADVPVYKSTDGGGAWSESYEGIPGKISVLLGVWGSSPSDVFAVSRCGVVTEAPIYRYNGTAWTETGSGVVEDLNEVWGSSASNVFAVGSAGMILHYDGQNWETMISNTSETLNGVWGTSGSHVFAVGASGTVLRYDGGAWSVMPAGTAENLNSVRGSSGTDLFAMGDNGVIIHYDGSTWSAMASGTSEDLNEVWAASSSDGFAVGDGGTILRYDGTSWTAMAGNTTEHFNGVWGTSDQDVFAVGTDGIILHYDGTAWSETRLGSTENLTDVWGSEGADVFAVGARGSIFHYSGAGWTEMKPAGSKDNAVTDLAFHPQDSRGVYAATWQTGVYASPNQGGRWLNLGTPEQSVHAISTGSLYAGTESGVLQCTGTGLVAGVLTDHQTSAAIDGALVFTDLGAIARSVNGEYMMVCPAGVYSLTAVKDNYANLCLSDVTVNGGDVSWVDMDMAAGVSDASVLDGDGDGNDGDSSDSSLECFVRALKIPERTLPFIGRDIFQWDGRVAMAGLAGLVIALAFLRKIRRA